MGVIQGSINNLLTTAGVAARLSPKVELKLAEQKGAAEAEAHKATVEAEAVPATEKAQQVIKGTEAYFTKSGAANLKYSAEHLEGQEKELDKAIGYLQKAEALSSTPERQSLLESAYETKSKLRSGVEEKRKRKAEAERQAEEALALEQEQKQKSEQFRQMFTQGGRFK